MYTINSNLIKAAHEQELMILQLACMFKLSKVEAERKFTEWVSEHTFTYRVGYKRICLGDISFLDY